MTNRPQNQLAVLLLLVVSASACLDDEAAANVPGLPEEEIQVADGIASPLRLGTNATFSGGGIRVSVLYGEQAGTCVIYANMTGRHVEQQPQLFDFLEKEDQNGRVTFRGGGFMTPPFQAHAGDLFDSRTIVYREGDWWSFTSRSQIPVTGPGSLTSVTAASAVQLPPPGHEAARRHSMDVSVFCSDAQSVSVEQADNVTLFWAQNMNGGVGVGAPVATYRSVSHMDSLERTLAAPTNSLQMSVGDPASTHGTITIETPDETKNWQPSQDGVRSILVTAGPGSYRVEFSVVTDDPIMGILGSFQPVGPGTALGPL